MKNLNRSPWSVHSNAFSLQLHSPLAVSSRFLVAIWFLNCALFCCIFIYIYIDYRVINKLLCVDMYMYICEYIYIYIYMYMYMYICIYVYVYIYISMYLH